MAKCKEVLAYLFIGVVTITLVIKFAGEFIVHEPFVFVANPIQYKVECPDDEIKGHCTKWNITTKEFNDQVN